TGYNNQSIAYFMIFQNPNVDLGWYRPVWKRGLVNVDQVHPFSSFIDNPYLITYEMTNSVNSHAVIGNMSAVYEFSKNLDLMVRSGIDMNNEFRGMRRPYSSANYQRGFYREQNIQFYEINSDFLLSYRQGFGKDHRVTASLGGNIMNRNYNRVDGSVENLIIPGLYKLNNGATTPFMFNEDQRKKVHSIYGLATYSWKDRIFVDVTARNDWSSALPVNNNSYFYPSVNTSFILSELFNLPAPVSFLKARFSYAQGGNDTRPYYTRKYYGASDFPGSGSVPTVLYNPDFKPELSSNYEAGIDLRLFNNRIGIDATIYRNTTKNQILEGPVDNTSGYTTALLNAGEVRNQGFELIINAQPVKGTNFNWNTTLTWSTNQNRVLSLTDGFGSSQIIGIGGNATIQATVGGSTGDIYGFGFVRDPAGNIVYTSAGLPARPPAVQFIGNAYAKWKGGLRNEFSYKRFRASFMIDGQYGGIIYSQSHHKMSEQGKLKHTLAGRETNSIIGEGVVLGADNKYVPNTKAVLPADFYADYYRRANVESNSFDASYIKLREVRFEYALPKKMLAKGFFQDVIFAVYGRDLAMISNFPVFDPETAALNGSTILPGIEMGQLPSTRSFGANITLKF
ncbi:MAG: TonB-dependent receptor, partial [Sphingobacteriales bacterium]